jgi:hypothetical protein
MSTRSMHTRFPTLAGFAVPVLRRLKVCVPAASTGAGVDEDVAGVGRRVLVHVRLRTAVDRDGADAAVVPLVARSGHPSSRAVRQLTASAR